MPLVGTAAGGLLALADLWLEDRVRMPPAWTYSASTASSLLSGVAAAMVGLLGLVVTIGVLVVQMATGTLSPRFMRLWYRDRLQKLVLASFTATFVFSYALLRRVGTGTVPDLGVTIAGIAVTLDLILLLLYLDRFVHTLRPVAVAAAMARAGLRVIGRTERATAESPAVRRPAPTAEPDLRVRSRGSGAIQAVHVHGLLRYATTHDLVCVLRHAVGDFVTQGGVLADVYGPVPPDAARRVRGMVALGPERTLEQDPAFALRIIVDIAIRALSPAVNDPTTATQMLNYVGTMLVALGTLDLTGIGTRTDAGGAVRLLVPTRGWEDYLELGVGEIRQYGAGSRQTCRRLRALLQDLEADVLPANRPAVQRQLAVLDRVVMSSFADLEERRYVLTGDRQGVGGASPPPDGTG